ncbi:MAG: hypothetical protein Q9190_001516 [Brigantiaea leucoxantha]
MQATEELETKLRNRQPNDGSLITRKSSPPMLLSSPTKRSPRKKGSLKERNHNEKTIEGDLFAAFVAAGAISKVNADDPKKSSFVRCARTDRGVHAAGNIISLKMIIEDPEVVKKINDSLSPQIRVWGFERTNGSFSAYNLCDSRIYEYLIPTHCFLPPHPDTFLAKKLVEIAAEENDSETYRDRQMDAYAFWTDTHRNRINPFIENLDPETRSHVESGFQETNGKSTTDVHEVDSDVALNENGLAVLQNPSTTDGQSDLQAPDFDITNQTDTPGRDKKTVKDDVQSGKRDNMESCLKDLKDIIIAAKKAYRIHPSRLERVRSTLRHFNGTHNFHNYTISKTPRDPSAKRVIKSFTVGDSPVIINNTEWLSLKVHGQSFMMHQIRKMVTMAAMVVRCGCHEDRMQHSYEADKLSIPKAPSLGLLLERPVFDSYNKNLSGSDGERRPIDFSRYEKEIDEFKQREIYERIYREEERDDTYALSSLLLKINIFSKPSLKTHPFTLFVHRFHTFFSSLDNHKSSNLLYFSSAGVPAIKRPLHSTAKDSADITATMSTNTDPPVSFDSDDDDAAQHSD